MAKTSLTYIILYNIYYYINYIRWGISIQIYSKYSQMEYIYIYVMDALDVYIIICDYHRNNIMIMLWIKYCCPNERERFWDIDGI